MGTNDQKLLQDVVLIRILLIFLLIIYHSFLIYAGSWQKPDGYANITAYWWVAKAAYAGMLESFVFISGYLFAYQQEVKGKTNFSFKKLLIDKFKRLIIPCFLFSLLYYYIFIYNGENENTIRLIMQLFNGEGHLWFLPMLFWCFVFGYFLTKFQLKKWKILVFLIFFATISGPLSVILPFQIGISYYYLLFFYLGYLFWNNKEILKRFVNLKYVIIALFSFVIVFISLTILQNHLITYNIDHLFIKAFKVVLKRLSSITYSLFGVFLIYISANYYLSFLGKSLNKTIVSLSSLSFGVYIYQEFILKLIYYKSPIPALVGPYWLPFVGLVITIILSLALSKLTLSIRIGRYLLG